MLASSVLPLLYAVAMFLFARNARWSASAAALTALLVAVVQFEMLLAAPGDSSFLALAGTAQAAYGATFALIISLSNLRCQSPFERRFAMQEQGEIALVMVLISTTPLWAT
jgi:hypothetical protein